jgi:hypothetical protein
LASPATTTRFSAARLDVSGLVEPSFPYPAMPLMSIPGFTNATQGDYQDIPENIINIKANVTWITGRHRFKTGVNVARNYAAQININGSNVLGQFTFNNNITGYSLANFLLSAFPTLCTATIPLTSPDLPTASATRWEPSSRTTSSSAGVSR